MSKYLAVAKINFKKTTYIAYMVAAICMLAMIADIIVDVSLKTVGDSTVSIYCMSYLVCVMAPIFIASDNYSKFMNIGVKKKTYFFGCIINYIVFATITSAFGVAEHYLIDLPLANKGFMVYENIYGLIGVFGWGTNAFTAFFSQFAFLLLVQSIIHTLVFMQTKWYGWVADVLIVAIISVFTPIPALRSALVFFFNMTIFIKPAIIHIGICLLLAAGIYSTNLFYLKKRV